MKKLFFIAAFAFCGTMAFSQTEPVMNKTAYLTNLTGKTMQAYPNPAKDQVTIQHVSSAERGFLMLISTDGKILQQRTVMPNTLQTQINIGMLSNGAYIVKYDDGKGDVRMVRLMKN